MAVAALAAAAVLAGCVSQTGSKPAPAAAGGPAKPTISSAAASAATAGGVVCGFEDAAEAKACAAIVDNATVEQAKGKGVTQGANCLRFTAKKGADYASFCLGADAVARVNGAKTILADVYTDEGKPVELRFQLWDKHSVDSASRCTLPQDLKQGQQTLKWDVAAPDRNSGHGQLNMKELTKVKFYIAPPADHDVVIYFDNLRVTK